MANVDELIANSVHYRDAARGRESLVIKKVVKSEISGIAAAIDSLLVEGDYDKAARVLEGYQRYFRDLDEESRVKFWLGGLLEQEEGLQDEYLRFFLHELQYLFDFHSGETKSARSHVETLFEFAERLEDDLLYSRAYVAACRLDLRDHSGDALEEHAERLATHAGAARDSYFMAFSHHMIANLREMEGNTREAVKCYKKSMALFQECGADFMVHTESFNLAACALDLNEIATARQSFSNFAALSRELEEDHLTPELFSCLSLLLLKEGEAELAAQLMGASQSALAVQGRHLYPAEEKISAETINSLRRELGNLAFDAHLKTGQQLDTTAALYKARIS